MLGICLDNVRKTVPLVHNITNYVTVNDVANILLACGGSPIMSDEPEDVEDITSICGGLNINIGTLNQRSIQGMLRAGKKAAQLHHVLLLDPVGAGASALRTNTAVDLMEQLPFTVIRGNISEIKTLALGSGKTRGVDADVSDAVSDENLDSAVAFVKDFAQRSHAIVGDVHVVIDDEGNVIIPAQGLKLPGLRQEGGLRQGLFPQLQHGDAAPEALLHHVPEAAAIEPVAVRYGVQQQVLLSALHTWPPCPARRRPCCRWRR